jgi:hypothetical protein
MPRKTPSRKKVAKKPAAKGGDRAKAKPPKPPAKKKPPPKAEKPVPKAPPPRKGAAKAPKEAAAPAAKATPAAILAAKALKRARAAKKVATPKPAPRLKIIWAVCDHTLKTIKTFPYPERRAAELEAERLQKSKGKEHVVRAERVPMTEARR